MLEPTAPVRPGHAHAVDDAVRALGDAIALFDPLRFRFWSNLGITTGQLRVLFLIRGEPGVTAGALASRVGVTPPTISGIVDRLVRLGLVRREEDRNDRRLVRNYLDEQGEAACMCVARDLSIFTRRIAAGLDESALAAFVEGVRAFVAAGERTVREGGATFDPITAPGSTP